MPLRALLARRILSTPPRPASGRMLGSARRVVRALSQRRLEDFRRRRVAHLLRPRSARRDAGRRDAGVLSFRALRARGAAGNARTPVDHGLVPAPFVVSTSPGAKVPPPKLVIATRESALAMWQARHVGARLSQLYPACKVEILGITTTGDRILDKSLADIGGKGLFIKELEQAMENGRADLAVHSLKDVPMDMPPGFSLAAIMSREDPRDALVSSRFRSLAEIPAGSRLGTSSLRREAQLRERFPLLEIASLRGNVNTRLRKLDEGNYAAIILAVAGLKRLGLAERIAAFIDPVDSLPAPGQGALAIECLADRADLVAALRPLAGGKTTIAALGGTPIICPAIVIAPPVDRAPLASALRELASYDFAVFVSTNAVEHALADAGLWPAQIVAFAPGPSTAAALHAAGVTSVRSPDCGTDSEALLALPELSDLAGKRVVIF